MITSRPGYRNSPHRWWSVIRATHGSTTPARICRVYSSRECRSNPLLNSCPSGSSSRCTWSTLDSLFLLRKCTGSPACTDPNPTVSTWSTVRTGCGAGHRLSRPGRELGFRRRRLARLRLHADARGHSRWNTGAYPGFGESDDHQPPDGGSTGRERLCLEGQGWGYGGGVDVNRDDPWTNSGRYGWVCGTGTTAYLDPARDTVSILFTQLEMSGPTSPTLMRDFWQYAADLDQ